MDLETHPRTVHYNRRYTQHKKKDPRRQSPFCTGNRARQAGCVGSRTLSGADFQAVQSARRLCLNSAFPASSRRTRAVCTQTGGSAEQRTMRPRLAASPGCAAWCEARCFAGACSEGAVPVTGALRSGSLRTMRRSRAASPGFCSRNLFIERRCQKGFHLRISRISGLPAENYASRAAACRQNCVSVRNQQPDRGFALCSSEAKRQTSSRLPRVPACRLGIPQAAGLQSAQRRTA